MPSCGADAKVITPENIRVGFRRGRMAKQSRAGAKL